MNLLLRSLHLHVKFAQKAYYDFQVIQYSKELSTNKKQTSFFFESNLQFNF